MNAVFSYRVKDAQTYVSAAEESRQTLYREAQLALRSVVGTYSLDSLLSEKEKVAGNAKMNVVLGEKGMADRIVNLL